MRTAPTVATMGRVGEVLLATSRRWRVHRLGAAASERDAAHRANLKRQLDELTRAELDAAVLVVVGATTRLDDGALALITGPLFRDYPDDATLPLRWIQARLRTCRAPRLVAVFALWSADDAPLAPAAALDELGTELPGHLIAVGVGATHAAVVDELHRGLSGDATAADTGTVTMTSLSAHLAARCGDAALQRASDPETLLAPPPLSLMWHQGRPPRTGRARGPAADDLTTHVLPGRIRIDERIATGSFGVVYRGRQLTVDRDVAIKVLHPAIDPSSEDGRLFVEEIQHVGRLDHPNIVRIHLADLGPDGRLFFVMELLDGRDLQHVLDDEGPLEATRAQALALQLLGALDAAHEAGLVHADVKPGNALIVPTRDGERLVLVDFGLARLRRRGEAVASAGGTPAYMAPEQLALGRVDARSDLYAAGLVLATMLTGWRRRAADQLAPPLELIADPGSARAWPGRWRWIPTSASRARGRSPTRCSGARRRCAPARRGRPRFATWRRTPRMIPAACSAATATSPRWWSTCCTGAR